MTHEVFLFECFHTCLNESKVKAFAPPSINPKLIDLAVVNL